MCQRIAYQHGDIRPLTFWSKPDSNFKWLVFDNEVYQQFTYVGLATQPSPSSACCWQNRTDTLAGTAHTERCGIIVGALGTRRLPVSHCP